jgi:hypothetical protein
VWVASRHLSCSFGHLAIMPGVGLSSMSPWFCWRYDRLVGAQNVPRSRLLASPPHPAPP